MFTDFLDSSFQGNTVRSWLLALAMVAGSIVVARLFYFLSTKVLKRFANKARGRLMYILIDMLEEPIALGFVIGGVFWAQRALALPKTTDELFSKIVTFAVILDLTWAIARLLNDLITQYLVPAVAKSDSKLDDQLLPVAHKASNVLIWLVGIIVAVDNAGYNVGAIVAGLGIGGLAFAFAAQETIANLFGGITIFIDSPFRIGDRIKIAGFEGWVRAVGMRTAKLETLDGRRLTLPNALFSKSVIENVSSEPATKVVETFRIDRSKGADSVEKALAILMARIEADEDLEASSTAFFGDLGDSSFDLTFVLWIKKGADLGAVRTRVNLAVLRDFAAAGIALALPTRFVMDEAR
jgi:MscS family membrane protein